MLAPVKLESAQVSSTICHPGPPKLLHPGNCKQCCFRRETRDRGDTSGIRGCFPDILNTVLLVPSRQQNDYDESNSKPCAKPDPEIQPPPPKRQRLVFDGVHLLTLAEVRQRQTEDEKSDFEKLALLKNVRRYPYASPWATA